MTLVKKMAEFLDPQMTLLILKYAEKNASLSPELQTLKRSALAETLLADEYQAAGGDSSKAAEMRTQASSATDPHSLYAAGQYERALEALRNSGPANAWGQYASDILAGNYSAAAAVISQIEEIVEKPPQDNTAGFLNQLNQRAWFIHWVLFALFRIEGGREKIVDHFFQSQCMTTIQTVCPWILRYLAVAVVIASPRRLRDLSRAIAQESYEYTDDVLDFILSVTTSYSDITTLGKKLEVVKQLLASDYFANAFVEDFTKSAHHLIVGQYVKAHTSVNKSKIAAALSIPERKVTELIAGIYSNSSTRASNNQRLNERIAALNQRAASTLAQARSKSSSGK